MLMPRPPKRWPSTLPRQERDWPGHMSFRARNEDAALPNAWYRIPYSSGPIGAAAGPELAAAVSNAGGLGCVALTGSGCEGARRRVRRIRKLTNRSFIVNFVMAYDVEAEIEAVLEEAPALTSFFWGDPSPYVDRVHAAGSRLMMTVGSVEEAKKAVGVGVDIIVAQGWEAGGHVRGLVSTSIVIPAVVDAVAPIPVVAAGGIADGRGLAAVLALGAGAAWINRTSQDVVIYQNPGCGTSHNTWPSFARLASNRVSSST
jgi:NAD(P)H-dependent flavin oxidoreductase YrpB (nitropropane dioxygenase family)